MRRYNVVLSEAADLDLDGILTYVADKSGSARIAKRFTDRILARSLKIGDMSFSGRRRDDLSPGLRTIPFEKPALIAYRIQTESVEILNVFYGGRGYEALDRDHDADP